MRKCDIFVRYYQTGGDFTPFINAGAREIYDIIWRPLRGKLVIGFFRIVLTAGLPVAMYGRLFKIAHCAGSNRLSDVFFSLALKRNMK